jgi:hypothetical protein
MRRWGLAAFVCVVVAPTAAWAQADVTASSGEPEAASTPQEIVYGAMPGGIHAPEAENLPAGIGEVSTLAGFGYRKGLLGPNERFGRALGDIAAAYAPIDILTIGLSLDGRYDRHYGGNPSPDDGYVGDPHLNVRLSKAVGANHFGAQLGIWVPGKNAPSIAGSATSLDIRGLASFAAGPATVSLSAGFRIDNSAKSVDDVTKLSLQDRVSLGASNYNAVLGGLYVAIPAGKAFVGLESTFELYVGSAPTGMADLAEGSLLLRGALTAGMHFTDQWSGIFFLEAAKSPGILTTQVMNASIPIIPYEPVFTAGFGLQARFGGPKHTGDITEKDCHKHNPPDCPAVKVPLTADITGTVVDEAGKAVVGAKVSLVLKNSQVAPVATDEKGTYTFKGVPIGNSVDNKPQLEETGIDVNVSVDGKKPGKAAIAQVAAGPNTAPEIKLEPVLPPGQLKVLVRDLKSGKPIANAKVAIEGSDKKFDSGADGVGQLDVPPGTYKITVNAPGYAAQELDVTIEPNGVVFKNIDLHK